MCLLFQTGASKPTDVTSMSNNILSTLQLNEMVAASGAGATAESLLQSVVNLVGAAQAMAAVTSSAETVATSTATAEDTGKGVCVCVGESELFKVKSLSCIHTFFSLSLNTLQLTHPKAMLSPHLAPLPQPVHPTRLR